MLKRGGGSSGVVVSSPLCGDREVGDRSAVCGMEMVSHARVDGWL